MGTPSSESMPGKSTRDIKPRATPEKAMTGYSNRPAMNQAFCASRVDLVANMRW